MTQLQTFFQLISGIQLVSDKITTILIFIITFFLLDQKFEFSENYRQNEIHSRLKDLFELSSVGNDTAKRVKGDLAEITLVNEIIRLQELASNPDSDSKKMVDEKICHEGDLSLTTCDLNMLTSGFWFLLYGFGSLLYVLVLKFTPEIPASDGRQAVEPTEWGPFITAALFIIFILAILICLISYFTSALPIFYSPVINYILNITISGYFLQAVTKVLGAFFRSVNNESASEPAKAVSKEDEPETSGLLGWVRKLFSK